jgi:hypothetical protein
MSEAPRRTVEEYNRAVWSHVVYRWLIIALSAALAASADAQVPLSLAETAEVNRVLDDEPAGDRLRCTIERKDPDLDFEFRFTAGYTIECPLKLFEGRKSFVNTFVRVTPEDGGPVLLGGSSNLPALPDEMAARTNLRKLNTNLELSGAFALGEGRYIVEVLATDDRERTCRKQWRINVVRRHAVAASTAIMKANTVAPADLVPWDGRLQTAAESVRLTVLLDVAPINPREPTLRAWDRLLLLDSLSSLLRELPCKSVRLVAFNLDQQREVYRSRQFRGGDEFQALEKAMQQLELGTVSYHLLQQQQGWAQMLWRLTSLESKDDDPPDAVIILGPATRTHMKVDKAELAPREFRNPQFFYFEYSNRFGNPFPDSMGTLTKALGGTVFIFHWPQELAQDIQKMLRKLKPGVPPEATASRWPARPAPKP